jgi:hypothetical protein
MIQNAHGDRLETDTGDRAIENVFEVLEEIVGRLGDGVERRAGKPKHSAVLMLEGERARR